MEVVLDNPSNAQAGSLAVGNTGELSSWRTIPANISTVNQGHTPYLEFSSGASGNAPFVALAPLQLADVLTGRAGLVRPGQARAVPRRHVPSAGRRSPSGRAWRGSYQVTLFETGSRQTPSATISASPPQQHAIPVQRHPPGPARRARTAPAGQRLAAQPCNPDGPSAAMGRPGHLVPCCPSATSKADEVGSVVRGDVNLPGEVLAHRGDDQPAEGQFPQHLLAGLEVTDSGRRLPSTAITSRSLRGSRSPGPAARPVPASASPPSAGELGARLAIRLRLRAPGTVARIARRSSGSRR